MANGAPTTGDFPSGATMRPRYMGRTMNTYPVSEPEMEHISLLSAQATTCYSLASLLIGLASSIWINATFYKELTPEATVATKYVAPLMLVFAVLFVIGAGWAQYRRKSVWDKIKADSTPLQAVATTTELVVATSAVAAAG
jgi:hypothetical protein